MYTTIIQDIFMTLGSLILLLMFIIVAQVVFILFKIHSIINHIKSVTKRIDLGTLKVISSILSVITGKKDK